jgi:hypothetical protein
LPKRKTNMRGTPQKTQKRGKCRMLLSLILLVFAFVLFVLAVVPSAPNPPRWNLIGWGLAAWVLAELFRTAGPVWDSLNHLH